METTTSQKAGLSWKELCDDPNLRDLPYKIETNQWGQVVMSPTYRYHGRYAVVIARKLEDQLPEGKASVESAVRTSKGTKVADASWDSSERWELVKDSYDAPIAPEICVEVLSPTNAPGEIEQKKKLYFEAGAEEVWLCDKDGNIRFFAAEGEMDHSVRAPGFPPKVEM